MNPHTHAGDRSLVGPLMTIIIGVILLVSQFVPELSFDRLWPLLLIGAGVAALFGRRWRRSSRSHTL